ncbi:MAG: EAL domain-containing protein [Gammaproteobacteria bacterium]|nr:EAL domain-containing protein [Gammaproteobacteria bacterium]
MVKERIVGATLRQLLTAIGGDEALRDLWHDIAKNSHWSGEIELHNGGVDRFLQLSVTRIENAPDSSDRLICLFTDITTLKAKEQQLEALAHYDNLTGLPNRFLLIDRLQTALKQVNRRKQQLALLFLDLDGFKAVNDRFGHEAGDYLLQVLAKRMEQTLRDGDTVARIGGDEFIILLPDVSQRGSEIELLQRLLAIISAPPVTFDRHPLTVSASIGVTFYPQSEELGAEQLLRQADEAMYGAKRLGKNRYQIYEPHQKRLTQLYSGSIGRLQQALQEKELRLYYQPKFDTRSGEIEGFEALLRWNHPQQGVLAPAEFLPLVEGHSLMEEIGSWVLESAMEQMVQWQDQGLSLPVSVNVAARQLQQDRFVEEIAALLCRYPRLDPALLELEIVESSTLTDIDTISQRLQQCRDLGLSIALDDFGTGYSSLVYLKRLPANHLKIDKGFVRDMLHDADDLTIVTGILSLSVAFGMKVIAEGVESPSHAIILSQLGCRHLQGYCISRPMPAAEVIPWLRQWQPDPSLSQHGTLSADDQALITAVVRLRSWIHQMQQQLLEDRHPNPLQKMKECTFVETLVRHQSRLIHGEERMQTTLHHFQQLKNHARQLIANRQELTELELQQQVATLLELQDQTIASLKTVVGIHLG